MKKSAGVTLIELLVTLSIAVILMAVAAPSFQGFMTSNQLSGYATDFMSNLNYARSEAVKRGTPVSICSSANGSSCSGAGGSWSDGWIVFENTDRNIATVAAAEILKIHEGLPGNYTAAQTAVDEDNVAVTNHHTTYLRNGTSAVTGTIVFCRDSNESAARAIIVTLTRPRVATDANSNGIPEKEDGTEIGTCEAP